MYRITFYLTERGYNPVREFFESLDLQTKAKVAQFVDYLGQVGPQLRRPIADKLRGKIYELRPKQIRVLYFFAPEKEIILVHAFIKKTDAVHLMDLATAERRRIDWISRSNPKEAD